MIPEKILEKLEKKNKPVLIQLPEGLKPKSLQISEELRAKGIKTIVSGDPCYGACDLKTRQGYVTLHVGHSKILEDDNVVYWEYKSDQNITNIALKAAEKAEPLIGLVTTVQHVHKLEEAKEKLEENGFKCSIGKGGKNIAHAGQVLGCDYSSALNIEKKVNSFLYIGSGEFHPQGLAAKTSKPVVAANPFTEEIKEIDGNMLKKEKFLRKAQAKEASEFGVVLSSKPGQENEEKALEVVERLRSNGKKAVLVELAEVTPQALQQFRLNAFVITACPRIVLDDWKNYDSLIVLPDEIT